VFVALVIQHAMRMQHIVICGPSGSTVLFHTVSLAALFLKKKIIEHKLCVVIFSTDFA
jgi:ribosomal protein L32